MGAKKTGIALILLLGGIWAIHANSPKCVNVYVDFGTLTEQPTKVTECVAESTTTHALDVLLKGGVKIDGTAKYGDKVVCRVDNLPGHDAEPCQNMPSEKAYWAILVKRRAFIPNPFDVNSKWNWAQTGIADVTLKPGDSIGLIFADNGKVRFP